MPDIPPHPSTPRDGWTPLKTAHCSAAVSPLGAILHDLTFTLPDGRKFAPLAEAEWSGRARPEDSPDLSPHLAELGGEWPCVPFGTSPADPQHHGFCSNAAWRLDAADGGSARLSIDYPAGHDIAQVARSIRLSPDSPSVTFGLEITAARDCCLPLGLHPIFRLPEGGAGVMLDWTGGQQATTLPKALAPLTLTPVPGAQITKGGPVACLDGTEFRFPAEFPRQREALVQIWDCEGEVALRYAEEAAGVRLTWAPEDLPHCLLWLANPGGENPGLGQFTGLGVEPVSSLFDRGIAPFDDSVADRAAGVALRAGEIWRTQYEISAFPLSPSV